MSYKIPILKNDKLNLKVLTGVAFSESKWSGTHSKGSIYFNFPDTGSFSWYSELPRKTKSYIGYLIGGILLNTTIKSVGSFDYGFTFHYAMGTAPGFLVESRYTDGDPNDNIDYNQYYRAEIYARLTYLQFSITYYPFLF